MGKFIFSMIFFMMIVVFVANPAPISIESEDLILLALPFLLFIFSLPMTANYNVTMVERPLLLAIMFYLSYLLISLLIGLLHGASLLGCLRAIGPYLNFFPLLMLGLLPKNVFKPRPLALILIFVGSLQISHQLFLYLKGANDINNTMDVLVGRITLIDPRTTLPLILSTAILPFGLLFVSQKTMKKTMLLKTFCAGLIVFSLCGALVTLTRAIILSLFFGWTLFGALYCYGQLRYKELASSNKKQLLLFVAIIVFVLVLLSELPMVKLLMQGVITRFNYSGHGPSHDYSNGRLYDEWMPAMLTWINSGNLGLFFGIGAGNTFNVITGEERTYIHNLTIYSLVYGGFFGLVATLYLYLTAFKTLLRRAWQTKKMIYVSFAALLGTLFFYGQLFAVHKGLAYNALLFLILSLALTQPYDKKPYGE